MTVASDPYFNAPIQQYTDEASFWFCNLDQIFVRYVSNDESFGKDTSLWSQIFRHFVAGYLAWQIAPRIKNDIDVDKLEWQYKNEEVRCAG